MMVNINNSLYATIYYAWEFLKRSRARYSSMKRERGQKIFLIFVH